MAITLPIGIRVAAGLVGTAFDRLGKLPEELPGIGVTVAGQLLRTSMRVRQEIAELAIRGDDLLAGLSGGPQEHPEWATFDDDEEPDRSATPADHRFEPPTSIDPTTTAAVNTGGRAAGGSAESPSGEGPGGGGRSGGGRSGSGPSGSGPSAGGPSASATSAAGPGNGGQSAGRAHPAVRRAPTRTTPRTPIFTAADPTAAIAEPSPQDSSGPAPAARRRRSARSAGPAGTAAQDQHPLSAAESAGAALTTDFSSSIEPAEEVHSPDELESADQLESADEVQLEDMQLADPPALNGESPAGEPDVLGHSAALGHALPVGEPVESDTTSEAIGDGQESGAGGELSLSLADLKDRLPELDTQSTRDLLSEEESGANRAAYLTLLTNRLTTLEHESMQPYR